MNSKLHKVIGVMSGTSLDGLDIIYVEFAKDALHNFQINCSETIKYTQEWESKLREGVHKNSQELQMLDAAYGTLLAQHITSFIEKHQLTEVDFIASHGHTILHTPAAGVTLQIGNGAIIAKATGLKVICDFRTQDVQLGGQGAPLVPIGDQLLFSTYDACLNLGGFANISYAEHAQRIAYDIAPINIVLNYYTNHIGLAYDDKGNIAATGVVHQPLLRQLNQLEFYKKKPPKSLGLEWVQAHVLPLIDSFNLATKDLLRTCVEHMAIQISNALVRRKEVLVTGGGVFNSFLMERISQISSTKICIPSTELIEYKEALIFGLLGVLRADNQVNCLKSVTGARKDHSAGELFHP